MKKKMEVPDSAGKNPGAAGTPFRLLAEGQGASYRPSPSSSPPFYSDCQKFFPLLENLNPPYPPFFKGGNLAELL
jgi:hypothetical protein